MSKISSSVARRQAEICVTLVKETDCVVVEGRRSADQVLAGFYRQHREYGARDRRFFSNAVFSWFRWRGWLKTPTNENIAAAILLDALEIPLPIEYIIQQSKLCQRQLKSVAGLAEASLPAEAVSAQAGPGSTLRPCSGQAPPATTLEFLDINLTQADLKPLGPLNFEDKMARLQSLLKTSLLRIEQLAPNWFSDFLFIPADCKPEAHLRRCLESFQTRPPTWLRLRADQIHRLTDLLTQMKIETGTHPFIEQAVYVKGPKNCDLSQLPGAEAQDLASQCVGICCNPKAGEQWWDVCAGAGGKSLHLADLMQDNGLILATDIRTSILDQLSKRLKRNNYRSIRTSAWNGIADPAPDKYFDGVLVDAPCSGMGTWARNPDARWRIFPDQILDYADVQSKLLQIAATKVKSGGRLVYSTCTLTTVENTDVIKYFLEQHQEFKLEPIFNPSNHKQSNGLIWIWPWEWNCNGMFIAVLIKIK